MNVLDRLKKKVGPLPIWAWASIASGVGYFYMRRKGADTSQTDSSQLPQDVSATGAPDVGDLPGTGTSGGGVDTGGGIGSADLGDKGLQDNIDAAKGQIQDFTDWLGTQQQPKTSGGEDTTTTTTTTDPTTTKSTSHKEPVKKPGGHPKSRTKFPRPRKQAKRSARPHQQPPPSSPRNRSGPGAAKRGGGNAGARPRNAPPPRHVTPQKSARPRTSHPLRHKGERPR